MGKKRCMLTKFLKHVRAKDAYANLEVNYETTDKLITWLRGIPPVPTVSSIPERVITHDPEIDQKRARVYAWTKRIEPKVYLLLRLYITKLLNRVNYSDTIYAIKLLEALYGVNPLVVSYGNFEDVAFTNSVDRIFLHHLLFTKQFEDAKAHFKRDPSVSHIALVVLHEFGHILYGPSEPEADEFVNDFFRDIVPMEYILSVPFRNPYKECKDCQPKSLI